MNDKNDKNPLENIIRSLNNQTTHSGRPFTGQKHTMQASVAKHKLKEFDSGIWLTAWQEH